MANDAPQWDDIAEDPTDGLADKFGGPRTSAPKAPTAPRKLRATKLETSLTKFYVSIGAVVSAFDPICGEAVVVNAPEMAISLDQLAQTNAKVKAALESLVATSTWGLVVAAHAPLIITIASHHVPAVRDRLAAVADAMTEQE